MRGSAGVADEDSRSWFSVIMACLAPFRSCFKGGSRYDDEERVSMIYNSRPTVHSKHVVHSESMHQVAGRKLQKGTRKSFGSGRTSSTGRSRPRQNASSSRPFISAPTGFYHVQSGSLQLGSGTSCSSSVQSVSRPDGQTPDGHVARDYRGLRPLELSIYLPHHRLSPILPHLGLPNIATPPPPPAHCAGQSEKVFHLSRQRSSSSKSFHIPRRQISERPSSAQDGVTATRVLARPRYRARTYTTPEADALRERVASALIEVDQLQRQIDHVIERQSIYVSSRPSTSHSMARAMPESMPSIPSLPPAAPSFAERLNARLEQPPSRSIKASGPAVCPRLPHEDDPAGKRHSHRPCHDGLLSPPLPLVFRPPLRKKKSFSAVSTWLFPEQELAKKPNDEPATHKWKPVKSKDEFYQIVSGPPGRRSCESFDSISTWHTEDEAQTATTTWSPGSTPKRDRNDHSLEDTATFDDARPEEPDVGIAM